MHNVLKDLGLSYKRPKLIVRSNDSRYRRKEKQARNYNNAEGEIPAKAPHLNPVEKLVNAPMKSVVCSNRSHRSIEEVITNTHRFFREHRKNSYT